MMATEDAPQTHDGDTYDPLDEICIECECNPDKGLCGTLLGGPVHENLTTDEISCPVCSRMSYCPYCYEEVQL